VPVKAGHQGPFLSSGWANNGILGPGDVIIVDGTKRDRAAWPGDMGIAVPSTFVSIGDLEGVKNALRTMYDHQVSTHSNKRKVVDAHPGLRRALFSKNGGNIE
jgi:hypothetical protein